MLEELCNSALYRACSDLYYRTPTVRLKGKIDEEEQEKMRQFFQRADFNTRYSVLPKINSRSGFFRKNSINWDVWRYFGVKNDENIVNGYIRDRWSGNLKEGMLRCGTYNILHDDYLEYFDNRRKRFMEKTEALMQNSVNGLTKKGKIPQSHGGVANLLKVLTRTMKEQGSGIENIAKMQYAICIQAGIYVIPEFLTDVLVAEEIMHGEGATYKEDEA